MPSSVILKTHYNPDTKDLTVVFVSGNVYVYKDVPLNVYISLQSARSKGKYLNEVIKGQFEFESRA